MLKGKIAIGNEAESKCLDEDEVAFVHQDDSFFAMLTVRETLELSLRLQRNSNNLDRSQGGNQDESLINDVISLMGLSKVAENNVGSLGSGDHSHGISGGERKRLSVACELLANPLLLIADEPTSGLDSFQALQVVQILHDLAVNKHIISICTIHQPRSSIWKLFDDIMLLTPLGKVAYHGPREAAVSYFEQLGYVCPTSTNPAEFLIDLVSIDSTSPKAIAESTERIAALTSAFAQKALISPAHSLVQHPDSHGVLAYPVAGQHGNAMNRVVKRVCRSFRRFTLLFERATRQAVRDGKVNLVRIGTSALLAFVVSSVYGHQGADIAPSSISKRINIIAQGAINVAMLSMIKTLQLFKKERSVIDRERAQNEYTALEYLLAKTSAELPLDALVAAVFGWILHRRTDMSCPLSSFVGTLSLLATTCSSLGLAVGALAPSGDVALAVGPALMVVYVIMGAIGPAGIGTDRLPKLLQLFRYCSPIKWACEALCAAEFHGKTFLYTSALTGPTAKGLPTGPAKVLVGVGSTVLKVISVSMRILRSFPAVRGLSQAVGRLIRPSTTAVSDGDRALDILGITDASYSVGMASMWKMLGSHLLLALVGLVMSRSQE
jgi:ABC-type multidrug transport system ATPase subunit